MSEPYAQPLREEEVDRDPLVQFGKWYEEARTAGIRLPDAATLATATPEAAPSARLVLVKGFDERGFAFFTSYASRKGRELAENARAALVFYWDPVGRQVRIEGQVERASPAESEAYFATRPRAAQLSAWASRQSEVVGSREELEVRVAEARREFRGRDVPLPPFWGGYRLVPETLEFWQHRENRLHDRLRYRRSRDGWVVERLAP